MPSTIRLATMADLERLRELQVAAMRALGPGFYTAAEIEAAVRHVCVPDAGLIEDGTYLVAELGGRLVGCGGWSLRRKAYAGPAEAGGDDDDRLDPRREPTRIRAMFTAPDVARQGIGRAILAAAEDGARAGGFARARLGATLSGKTFYRRAGYVEIGREIARLADGTALAVVLMETRCAWSLRLVPIAPPRQRPVYGLAKEALERSGLAREDIDKALAPMSDEELAEWSIL